MPACHDTTVRRHWEAARKVDTTGRASRSTRTGRWPKRPGPSSGSAAPPRRCPTAIAAAGVKTCPHANACLTCPMFLTTAEFLPEHHAQRQADPADRQRGRSRRPRPPGRDEPAGRQQPRQDHHHPRRPMTAQRPRSSRQCMLTPPPASPPPQPGATSSPAPRPSRPSANSNGPALRSPSRPSPAAAGISRSWLYTQPDIRDQIQRLRETTPAHPPLQSPPASGPPTPHCAAGSPPRSNATASWPRKTPGCDAISPAPSATSAPPGRNQVTISTPERDTTTPQTPSQRHRPRRNTPGHRPRPTQKLKITAEPVVVDPRRMRGIRVETGRHGPVRARGALLLSGLVGHAAHSI